MYTSLGTSDTLVCICGSWEKIMVDQRRSRRFFDTSERLCFIYWALTRPACMRKCSLAYRHIQGMYTSLGTGDILVRMCGSREKFMVDQRRSRCIFKQVKYSLSSIGLSHDLHACVNVLMHIDIFKGIYTSLGTGDILVRRCGSWEKIMVDQRRSRCIFKQVKYSLSSIELWHDLHACVIFLLHIDIFRGIYISLGRGDILVRMCGS